MGRSKVSELISMSVNSWIEVDKTGWEFIPEESFNDLKKHLVKIMKDYCNEIIGEIEEYLKQFDWYLISLKPFTQQEWDDMSKEFIDQLRADQRGRNEA